MKLKLIYLLVFICLPFSIILSQNIDEFVFSNLEHQFYWLDSNDVKILKHKGKIIKSIDSQERYSIDFLTNEQKDYYRFEISELTNVSYTIIEFSIVNFNFRTIIISNQITGLRSTGEVYNSFSSYEYSESGIKLTSLLDKLNTLCSRIDTSEFQTEKVFDISKSNSNKTILLEVVPNKWSKKLNINPESKCEIILFSPDSISIGEPYMKE